MDLFVVNRYQGDNESIENDEKSKLDKLFQKIEKNKKRQRKKDEKGEIIAKTTLRRQLKREIKSQIVQVPENNLNEFVEKSISNHEINTFEDEPKEKNRRKDSIPEGFTVLGAENVLKKPKVKRVLPLWLSEPTVISTNLSNLNVKVSSMKCLDKDLRKKLKENGVKYFFPVQAEVIPWLIETNNHSTVLLPQDVCVSAPTGSGKTLAFTLPIIQALKKYLFKKIRALVLLPTQDLALQVFKTFKYYCENTNVDVCFMTGKNPFEIEQKSLICENGAFGFLSKADIVVCTAGRLVDHLENTKGFDLSHLEFLIIDEADRVLENVQHDWLYHLQNISGQAPTRFVNLKNMMTTIGKSPRKLLFSATLSQDPEKLEKLSLFQPKLFTSIVENLDNNVENSFIGKYTTPKELDEKYIICDSDIKPLVLYKFIQMENLKKILIFTNSINETHRLSILLKKLFSNIRIEEINSDLGANRKKLIHEFSKGEINVIVCTDALARGIDLPGVECVVSYSAPKHLKTYIHRAGRTARAGSFGTAVTLLNTSQVVHFKNLLKLADKNNVSEIKVPTDEFDSLSEVYKDALDELKKIVNEEEQNSLEKIRRIKKRNKIKH